MQSNEIDVCRVESAHEAAFDQLVEIYTEAITPGGRKSLERLAGMILEPSYFFLVGLESERVVGFAIVRAFDGSDAALLEYLAVARDCRDHGIGSALLRQVMNLDAFSSRFLLAEVDSDKKPSADGAECSRRKQFYRRLGWKEIDQLDYIMPPVSSTLPPEMDMLVYSRALPSPIEQERLRHWLECCYVEIYNQSANDPRIETMTESLPLQVQLI
jgi:ribosomal protein S18 acetylase RimI-like enzyme